MNDLDKQSMILRGSFIRTPLFIPNLNEIYLNEIKTTGMDDVDLYPGSKKDLSLWLRDVYHPQIRFDDKSPINRSGNPRGDVHVFIIPRHSFPLKFIDPVCDINLVYKSAQVFTYRWFKKTECLEKLRDAVTHRHKYDNGSFKEICNTIVDQSLMAAYKSCPNAADRLYQFIVENLK